MYLKSSIKYLGIVLVLETSCAIVLPMHITNDIITFRPFDKCEWRKDVY